VDLAFPHHENEIAQSEGATGKLFVRYWLHAEHLIIEGEKMSKSLGNIRTLRDLFAQGHKPSTIRFLLASVPYRKQYNFTADGLVQSASAVERLRNFAGRLRAEKFGSGSQAAISQRIQQAIAAFDAALDDDLNTANALAAQFDLVRDLNIAADRGELRADDARAAQAALDSFDRIFGVLVDDDQARLAALGMADNSGGLSPAEIEQRIAERDAARQRRDFAAGDRIRQELAIRGIMLEDTKDGVRWKRK
jgi:cysteinyl-tRNA synthetase